MSRAPSSSPGFATSSTSPACPPPSSSSGEELFQPVEQGREATRGQPWLAAGRQPVACGPPPAMRRPRPPAIRRRGAARPAAPKHPPARRPCPCRLHRFYLVVDRVVEQHRVYKVGAGRGGACGKCVRRAEGVRVLVGGGGGEDQHRVYKVGAGCGGAVCGWWRGRVCEAGDGVESVCYGRHRDGEQRRAYTVRAVGVYGWWLGRVCEAGGGVESTFVGGAGMGSSRLYKVRRAAGFVGGGWAKCARRAPEFKVR